jgi:hypothetical protein
VVVNDAMLQTGIMEPEHGWVSYTAEDDSHLTDSQREGIRQREERKGRLMGIVEVRVYENECVPQITFPPGALLGIDAGPDAMNEMVTRARTELQNWR